MVASTAVPLALTGYEIGLRLRAGLHRLRTRRGARRSALAAGVSVEVPRVVHRRLHRALRRADDRVVLLAELGEEEHEEVAQETEPTEPTEPSPTEPAPTTDTTETTETGPSEPTEPTEPTEGTGDPVAGKDVFLTAGGCGSCHTLADAGTSGTVGPNLDAASPSFDKAVEQVTNGGGVMPPFKDTLSEQQIQDVAAYVSSAAGG